MVRPVRSLFIALLVLLTAVSAAPAQEEDAALRIHPEAARLQAQSYIVEGEYAKAGRYLQRYLKSNPDDSQAWLIQASVFEHIQRYDLAWKALDRAGDVRGAYLARARVTFKQDQFETATEWVRRALERDADYADAWHFLGYLQLTRKQYKEAEESLRTASEKGTTRIAANAYYLGQALYHQGKFEEAEEQLRAAQAEGEGTDYVKPSEDFLDLIVLRRQQVEREKAPPKPGASTSTGGARKPKKDWSAYAQLLFEYDTNVELLPDSALNTPSNPFGGKDSFRANLVFGGDWTFLRTGPAELHATGDMALIYHFADSAKDAQLIMLQGGSYADVQQKLGGRSVVWSPFVLGRVVMFGTFGSPRNFNPGVDNINDEFELGINDPFSIELEPGFRFAMAHSKTMRTGVTLSYTVARFTKQAPNGGNPQSVRDSHTFRTTVSETLLLGLRADNDLKLIPQLRAGLRFAEDQEFSYYAIEPGVRAEWRATEKVIAEAGLSYRYENHFKSQADPAMGIEARVDQTIRARAGGRYRLLKKRDWSLWGVGQYLLESNFSTQDGPPPNPPLAYTKHVISLGFRARF